MSLKLPASKDDQSKIDPADTLTFAAGLPPVPARLVKRIQDGDFIDMAELTIDRLSMSGQGDCSKPNHSKSQPVTSIVEWAQCYTNYVAIRGRTQPERIYSGPPWI